MTSGSSQRSLARENILKDFCYYFIIGEEMRYAINEALLDELIGIYQSLLGRRLDTEGLQNYLNGCADTADAIYHAMDERDSELRRMLFEYIDDHRRRAEEIKSPETLQVSQVSS